MLVAGEASGDLLGAELVPELRRRLIESESQPTTDWQPLRTTLEPEFFGAGGPRMASAGVNLAVDMTQHAVVGVSEVIRKYRDFQRLFQQLLRLAMDRQPDAIVCIDFSGFNLRLAHAIRKRVAAAQGTFGNWRPRIIQYVSPQVWASRPARAQVMKRDHDLLLSVIPFEKSWYAEHAPRLKVEFVGHPLIDRYAHGGAPPIRQPSTGFNLVLLPGSRAGEIRRHLDVMLQALTQIRAAKPDLRACLVSPNNRVQKAVRERLLPRDLELRVGDLGSVLRETDVALASTGTVTLECAYFGVPTVALYRTSWLTYQIGKRLIRVKFLAMPNLLAGEAIFPEFIQTAATASNLAQAVLALLDNPARREAVRVKLAGIVRTLGSPGASARAAAAIVSLVRAEPRPIRAALRP